MQINEIGYGRWEKVSNLYIISARICVETEREHRCRDTKEEHMKGMKKISK